MLMSVQGGNDYLDSKGYYKDQTKENIGETVNRIIEVWREFLDAQGEANLKLNEDYFIHKRNLYEVVVRLNKRKAYYYVYHHISEICEYKELGVLCYWINTLKPFMVVNENSILYNSPNEMFSLYFIISALAGIHGKQRPDEKFVLPDPKTVQEYVYTFKYCGLNREAMVFFIETLAKAYGIGMETKASPDKY